MRNSNVKRADRTISGGDERKIPRVMRRKRSIDDNKKKRKWGKNNVVGTELNCSP